MLFDISIVFKRGNGWLFWGCAVKAFTKSFQRRAVRVWKLRWSETNSLIYWIFYGCNALTEYDTTIVMVRNIEKLVMNCSCENIAILFDDSMKQGLKQFWEIFIHFLKENHRTRTCFWKTIWKMIYWIGILLTSIPCFGIQFLVFLWQLGVGVWHDSESTFSFMI